MNDIQKEPVRANLNDEKRLMERLQAIYTQAGKDIAEKIRFHDAKISVLLKDVENLDEEQLSLLQAQIYQRQFQKQLKTQIDEIMKNINAEQYDSTDDFMKKSYENGFIGTLYDIQSQGVPLIFPIDQQEVLDAMKMNSKISKRLYTHMGKDVNFLKRRIASDVARGIATSLPYRDIARNIERVSKIGFNRAMRIARTEGHNMRMQGIERAQHKAKERGADIVKQWDATLDARTRDSHARLDGEIRELDEKFSNGMMRPGDPNASAAEIVNCRCVLLQRARWALGANELKTLQERAEFFGLGKAESFEEFRRKYLKATELKRKGLGAKIGGDGVPEHEEPVLYGKIDYSNKNAVKNQLKTFEKDAIKESIETACVITKDGDVYKCFGLNDRVFPDFDLKDKLIGSSVSHNHPIEETTYSFSKDDLGLFMDYNLDVLRGCDEIYTYEFTKNANNLDDYPENWMNFENFQHAYIIELAKQYGIGYRRWKNE